MLTAGAIHSIQSTAPALSIVNSPESAHLRGHCGLTQTYMTVV